MTANLSELLIVPLTSTPFWLYKVQITLRSFIYKSYILKVTVPYRLLHIQLPQHLAGALSKDVRLIDFCRAYSYFSLFACSPKVSLLLWSQINHCDGVPTYYVHLYSHILRFHTIFIASSIAFKLPWAAVFSAGGSNEAHHRLHLHPQPGTYIKYLFLACLGSSKTKRACSLSHDKSVSVLIKCIDTCPDHLM